MTTIHSANREQDTTTGAHHRRTNARMSATVATTTVIDHWDDPPVVVKRTVGCQTARLSTSKQRKLGQSSSAKLPENTTPNCSNCIKQSKKKPQKRKHHQHSSTMHDAHKLLQRVFQNHRKQPMAEEKLEKFKAVFANPVTFSL